MSKILAAGVLASGALASGLLGAGGAQAFELKSSDIAPGATIDMRHVYKGFGCEGQNLSPALSWSNPPAGTKSYALLVHDPDAPTGGAGFWHWVVLDIPVSVTSLPRGVGAGASLPQGAREIRTDFGQPGWGGPCPPVGDKPHHYNFTIYAMKVEHLDVPEGATASLAGFLVNANSLGKATLTGLYGR